MTPTNPFEEEKWTNIQRMGADPGARQAAREFMLQTAPYKYSYNFTALGRPIIQFPQDMVAMQELIWSIRPDLIIETGVAHGGSLIQSAAMLALLDMADAIAAGGPCDPAASKRLALGIDIDIRPHNRAAIEASPMASRIAMIEGSSTSSEVIEQVKAIAAGRERVLVSLDSLHTHDHVVAELEAYAPLVSPGSYCVVFDTIIEDSPDDMYADRPWGKGDNPKTAVWEYLKMLRAEERQGADGRPLRFEIDKDLEDRLLITVAPDGYLKRVDLVADEGR